jgi:hypothetical protein
MMFCMGSYSYRISDGSMDVPTKSMHVSRPFVKMVVPYAESGPGLLLADTGRT